MIGTASVPMWVRGPTATDAGSVGTGTRIVWLVCIFSYFDASDSVRLNGFKAVFVCSNTNTLS